MGTAVGDAEGKADGELVMSSVPEFNKSQTRSIKGILQRMSSVVGEAVGSGW